MKITWIDKKSVLRADKRFFKAGDEIPADVLSPSRIELLKSQKKIRVGDPEVKKDVVKSEIYGREVEAEILPGVKKSDSIPVERPADDEPVKPARGRKAKDDNRSEE